jgi:hypothetical protein
MKIFNLAESQTDDSFCNNFCAVISKRSLLYWTNKKQAFFEILIPAIIMAVGIACTQIEYANRSPSRIMSPSRISEDPSMVVIDSYLNSKPGTEQTVKEIMDYFPDKDKYFDMRFTNSTMSFDTF